MINVLAADKPFMGRQKSINEEMLLCILFPFTGG